MFWKFLVCLLVLESFLGLKQATASVKNGAQILPKPEALRLPTKKTQLNQNVFNFKEHSVIQEDNTEEVKPTKYEHPYLIAHDYYRECPRHYRYHYHRYNYPEHVDYRYYYHHDDYYHNNGYYYPGYYYHQYYYPGYYHPRYYYHQYYRHGYYY